jgi:DNA-binding protein
VYQDISYAKSSFSAGIGSLGNRNLYQTGTDAVLYIIPLRASAGERLRVTAKKTDETSEKKSHGDSVILVGNKNVMSYVLACVTLFNKGSNEVVIKARGRLISRAVDVAEITRHRFISDLEVKKIEIDTTTVQTDKGSDLNVSTIDITLSK